MAKPAKLKCLRCGYEYAVPPSENPEREERTCPQCHSSSVRLIWLREKSND